MKVVLTTLFMAMVPVIELRGAIPFGVVEGLSVSQAMLISIIGNLIPVPVLLIFTKKVFEWIRTKNDKLNAFVCRMEARAETKKATVEKYEFFGLMILVAIPLPGTGAWTGCLVAAMMELKFRKAFPAIALGVLIAGLIVSWVTYGVEMFV